jgi:hypothetical protein
MTVMTMTSVSCAEKPTEGFSSDSLCVVYNGKTYYVNEKADRLVKTLGAPDNTISQASCHYGENGDEHTYEYYFGSGDYAAILSENAGNDDPANLTRFGDVLRIHTVPLKKDADYICDIDCYTSRFSTDKGITVGSRRDDVIKAYGDGFTDEGGGYLTYYDGQPLPETPRLMFYFEDGKVVFFSVSAAINF